MVKFCKPFLTGLLLSVLVIGTNSQLYCVKPENLTGNCPEKCAAACHNLMYYANNISNFSTNESTFLFLSGEHSLQHSMYVRYITNLTFAGDSEPGSMDKPTVQCNGSGVFYFSHITTLTIKSLQFCGCSYRTLSMYWIHNLTIKDVRISYTGGVGLQISYLFGNSHIDNTNISFSNLTQDARGQNLVLLCYGKSSVNHSTVLITNSHFLNGNNYLKHDRSHYKKASGIHILIASKAKINITLSHVTVTGNRGEAGGNIGIDYISYSTKWLATISILHSNITHGYGGIGGGLYFNAFRNASDTYNDTQKYSLFSTTSLPILTVNDTTFHKNKSPYIGAGVYIRFRETIWPMIGKVSFNNAHFSSNTLEQHFDNGHGGVAIHIRSFQLPAYKHHAAPLFEIEFINCNFTENVARPFHKSTSLPLHNAALYVQGINSFTLQECQFLNNIGTGIVAIQSFLLLKDYNIIKNNSGVRGGGMVLCARSMILLHTGTTLHISENNATEFGGGIYVESECDQDIPHCFFQVEDPNNVSALTNVSLENNYAGRAGSAIYGGAIDHCVIFTNITEKYDHNVSTTIFNEIFQIEPKEESSISSDPTVVCIFKDREECNASLTEKWCPNNLTGHNNIVPGSTIRVFVSLMGQRNSYVPGIVKAYIDCKQKCWVKSYQETQQIDNQNCSKLSYTVYSSDNTSGVLQLLTEGSEFQYSGEKFSLTEIILNIEKCPLGSHASRNGTCKSLVPPKDRNIIYYIIRKPPLWIGYRNSPSIHTNSSHIIYHQFCPLGYCREKTLRIHTTSKSFNQDAQCAQRRSGLLCGRCKGNYSLGFGTSKCMKCKNKPLPLLRVIGLIAVCAVAGILLVALLTLLNLTVTEGTLNGLVFYANIVQVKSDIFFPPETNARPWTAFIAWLNLDFGFTVCFYDGMDAYVKTWLQFLFPLYIWLISGAIVYFSWRSKRVARLAGRNAVKVLATLFLLSFGKLIRTIIAAVSFTNVASVDGVINMSVWLPDADIHYLRDGKHIILFIVAIFAGLMSFFYTLMLTFIQCLRRAPNNITCGLVQKFKPLLDAYTGPYKNKYHFWTGLLLLLRTFLFVSFAFNLTIGPTLDFALIIIVTTLLMIAIQPGIYRNKLVGLLECSLYVNLILFSTVMMFTIGQYTSQKTVAAYVFGGWALLTFLGIVIYHANKRFLNYPWLRMWCQKHLRPHTDEARVVHPVSIQALFIQSDDSDESEENEREHESMEQSSWNNPHFREPLIGSV